MASSNDSELKLLIQSWPTLPDHARETILSIVESTREADEAEFERIVRKKG